MVEAVGLQPDLFAMPKGAPPPGNTIVGPEKFWLVICTEAMEDERRRLTLTRGYKYIHETEDSANKEALRLANKFKGYAFAVVESMALVYYHDKKRRIVWEDCALEPYRRPVSIGEKHG